MFIYFATMFTKLIITFFVLYKLLPFYHVLLRLMFCGKQLIIPSLVTLVGTALKCASGIKDCTREVAGNCNYAPTNLLKLTLLNGCFSSFLNCTNGIKSRNAPQIVKKLLAINYFRKSFQL